MHVCLNYKYLMVLSLIPLPAALVYCPCYLDQDLGCPECHKLQQGNMSIKISIDTSFFNWLVRLWHVCTEIMTPAIGHGDCITHLLNFHLKY